MEEKRNTNSKSEVAGDLGLAKVLVVLLLVTSLLWFLEKKVFLSQIDARGEVRTKENCRSMYAGVTKIFFGGG